MVFGNSGTRTRTPGDAEDGTRKIGRGARACYSRALLFMRFTHVTFETTSRTTHRNCDHHTSQLITSQLARCRAAVGVALAGGRSIGADDWRCWRVADAVAIYLSVAGVNRRWRLADLAVIGDQIGADDRWLAEIALIRCAD